MTSSALSLIVLRTTTIESTLAFYLTLGLEFEQEQHGSGPIHYSCQIHDTVLEIYPGSEGHTPKRHSGGATMLGFRVTSVDATIGLLQQLGIEVVSAPKDSEWGRRAVVVDPDGRGVEITE